MNLTLLNRYFFLITSLFANLCLADCYFITSENTRSNVSTEHMRCDYLRYSTLVHCPTNIPLLSWVTLFDDTGNSDTSNRTYKLDKNAAQLNCQQSSSDTYASVIAGFDVGHLTAIDHLDDDRDAALETNYMTNLVPQFASFNRTGKWRLTEIITECYRDDFAKGIHIFSGSLIGSVTSNDYFISSHDLLKTPDKFWKLIITETNNSESSYDMWLFDNSDTETDLALSQLRIKYDNLVQLLTIEDLRVYQPVLTVLNEYMKRQPMQTTLGLNSKCHSRNG